MLIPFIFTTFLGILHILSEWISEKIEDKHIDVLSFSSGLFLAFIVLHLFPQLNIMYNTIHDWIYIIFLSGFSVFYIGEKYLYQHVKNKDELLKDLSILHYIGFVLDNLIIGFTAFLVFGLNQNIAIIVIIPMILHTINSSLSLEELHLFASKNWIIKISMAITPLIGAIIAYYIQAQLLLYFSIFAFAIGALLHIVVRDIMPRGENGNIFMFILGVVINVTLVIMFNIGIL